MFLIIGIWGGRIEFLRHLSFFVYLTWLNSNVNCYDFHVGRLWNH